LAARRIRKFEFMATTLYPSPQGLTEQQPEKSPRPRVKAFYEKYERYTGLAIFGVGFIWDSFTMTRVDSVIDNVILLFYLALIGAIIIITLRHQCGKTPAAWIRKIEPRFLWAMQFCFGGLFSSYVIFYFKSASFTRTQFFFLILVFLWVGNEFLDQRLKNPTLLAVLYCFCLFSFLAFFLPVVLAAVNSRIFMLAGFLSLAISLAVFAAGLRPDTLKWRPRMMRLGAWIVSVVLAVNILYFANLIPPVPLALKSAGIYHQVTRTQSGYIVKYVPPPFYRFWRKWDDPFYFSPGERVYCFTAVFAPGRVHVPIFHVWSGKFAKGWVRTDRIKFPISGGRDAGYRGYTAKSGIAPGDWRVEVETEEGQTLGRIDFTVSANIGPHPSMETTLIP
jgi:hypothetical protein